MGGPLAIFAISVLALVLGPLVHRWIWDKPRLFAGLDAFVVLAVLVLVLGEIAPLSFAASGFLGLATFLIGLCAPFLGDRLFGMHRSHQWTRRIVALGVLLHAFADGVGLSALHSLGDRGLGLALALILHRLPVGLGIWMLSPSRRERSSSIFTGRANALVLLFAVAVCTGLGQLWGEGALTELGVQTEVFSAFAAGMLLHIVVHAPPGYQERPRDQKDSVITMLACLGAVGLWQAIHQGDGAHAGHVHHLHAGWMAWAAPLAMLVGGTLRSEDAPAVDASKLGVGAMLVFVAGTSFGLWWAIGLAVLGWWVWHRRILTTPGLTVALLPQANPLRNLALSAWIATWVFELAHHDPLAGDDLTFVGLSFAVCAIFFYLMRPCILMIGLPLIASMQFVPSWFALGLLAECGIRAWSPGPPFAFRLVAFLSGAMIGWLGGAAIQSWARSVQPISGIELFVALVILALVYVWLSVRIGVRKWLAGGDLHRHDHH